MFLKKAFFVCIALALFASCLGNKNVTVSTGAITETDSDILDGSGQNTPPLPLTVEEAMQVIYENEERIKVYKREITFISKANFGVPGGENWIVSMDDDSVWVYAISGGKIVRRFYSGGAVGYPSEEYADFLMQGIPGTRIGDSTSSFGDFNGDGVDELFSYEFSMASYVTIEAYSAEKDDRVYLTNNLTFTSTDSYGNDVVPVQFMTYKGMYGFKYNIGINDVAGGADWQPEPNPWNYRWVFYTWDTEQKQYVEVGEVVDEENGGEDTSADS